LNLQELSKGNQPFYGFPVATVKIFGPLGSDPCSGGLEQRSALWQGFTSPEIYVERNRRALGMIR
jgi:hypothetical protein